MNTFFKYWIDKGKRCTKQCVTAVTVQIEVHNTVIRYCGRVATRCQIIFFRLIGTSICNTNLATIHNCI